MNHYHQFAAGTILAAGLLARFNCPAQTNDRILAAPSAVRHAVARPPFEPLHLAPYKVAPVQDIAGLKTAQSQAHSQVLAALKDLTNRIGSTLQASPAPSATGSSNPAWGGLSGQANLAGNDTMSILAPLASLFANGDQLGNVASGPVPDWQIFNAAFFSDPPNDWLNDAGSNYPGIFDCAMAMTSPQFVATTTANGSAVAGANIAGATVVPGNAVCLIIPCYYVPGWGFETYDHAHFEVQIERLNSSGQWAPMTRCALDMYYGNPFGPPAGVYTPPQGVPETVINVGGSYPYSLPWIVNIALPQVANTLRVDVYAELYDSSVSAAAPQEAFPNQRVYPIQPGRQTTDHQGIGTITYDPVAGHDWDVSPAFQVLVLPSYFGQAHALPYNLIYIPPGNKSDVKITEAASYGTTMSFQVGNQTQTILANVSGSSFSLAGDATYSLAGVNLGAKVSGTTGNQLTTTTQVQAQTNNQETLTLTSSLTQTTDIPINQVVNPPPAGDAFQRWQEPFWGDTIDLILNPVFAVWNCPSAGPGSPAFSAAQVISYQGGQSDCLLPLYALANSAQAGTNCIVPKTSISFTPQECASWLSLDPFYSGGVWQGAALNPARFAPVGTLVDLAANDSRQYNSTISSTSQSSTSVTGQTTGSTANQSQNSGNVALTLGPISPTLAGNEQQTVTTNIQVQYQSQAQTNIGSTVTSIVTIQDTAGLGSISVYLDLMFGSLAVQDTNEPNTGSLSSTQFSIAPDRKPVLPVSGVNTNVLRDLNNNAPPTR
jgi:hypothetical protein